MEELDALLELYRKTFGDSFPTFPMRSLSQNELMEKIKKCIAENKDAYDMGYLSLDEDVLY